MQSFLMPITATVRPHMTLHGKAGNVELTINMMITRKPDGKERRHMTSGTKIAENDLALCVVIPLPGKGLVLQQAVVFESADRSDPAVGGFTDAMRDYYSVNLRARELHDALHAVESSKRDAARTAALGKLRKVLAKEVELLQQENEPVLVQHVGPLEKRAQELLVDSPKEGAAKDGDPKDGATKDPPPKK